MGKVRSVGVLLGLLAFGWVGCSVEESGSGEGGDGGDGGEVTSGASAGEPAAGHGSGQDDAGGAGATDTGGSASGVGGEQPLAAAGAGGAAEAVAGPATVSVLALDDTPLSGIAVAFYDPDKGSPAIVVTDASGQATHDVLSKSFITVALEHSDAYGTYRALTTFFETEPGDDLVVREERTTPAEYAGTMTLSFPAYSGATHYFWTLACPEFPVYGSSYATSTLLNVYSRCLDESDELTVVVTAHINDDVALAYSSASALPFVADGAVSLGPWQTPASYDIAVANLPPSAVSTSVDVKFGLGLLLHSSRFKTFASDAPLAFHVPAPPSLTDSTLQTIQTTFPATGGSIPSVLRTSRESPSGAHQLDHASMLPRQHDALVTTDEQGLPELSWQGDGPLTGTHGAFVLLTSSLLDPPNGPIPLSWTLIAPVESGAPLSPPALPAELSAFAASQALPFNFKNFVALKSTSLGSYAALRHASGRELGFRGNQIPPAGDFVTLKAWMMQD